MTLLAILHKTWGGSYDVGWLLCSIKAPKGCRYSLYAYSLMHVCGEAEGLLRPET